MVEVEIAVRRGDAGSAVADAAVELGLLITSDGTLRTYPGSRHWHLKRPGASGTLELTLRPELKKMYISFHANRIGNGWVEDAAPRMAEMLSRALGRSADQTEISGSV
jgi:hypothetical protein